MIEAIVDAATVFQRTESGRDTIKNKTYKLTQSERLLLIVIDGVTSYETLRNEVWSLSQERFDRALITLLNAELIFEVMLGIKEQKPEVIDAVVVERFLKQDPLDPVTVISLYPEEDFAVGDHIPLRAVPHSEIIYERKALTPDPPILKNVSPPPVPAQETEPEPKPESVFQKSAEPPNALNLHDPWPSLVLNPATALLPDQTPQPVNDEWPAEWPEFLFKELPKPSRVKWAAWGALGGGVLIIILFIYVQLKH